MHGSFVISGYAAYRRAMADDLTLFEHLIPVLDLDPSEKCVEPLDRDLTASPAGATAQAQAQAGSCCQGQHEHLLDSPECEDSRHQSDHHHQPPPSSRPRLDSRECELEQVGSDQFVPHLMPQSACCATRTTGDQLQVLASVPSSCSFPGNYGFSVSLDEGGKGYEFMREKKLLLVDWNCPFPVTFHFTAHPCDPHCCVHGFVCYKRSEVILERGAVFRCLNCQRKDEERASSRDDGKRLFSYSFSCRSSCVAGQGRHKTDLVAVFTLVDSSGALIGSDFLNLRICASPTRDRRRLQRSETALEVPATKKRKLSSPSSPPPSFPLDLIGADDDNARDEDGYYTFVWRTRSKNLFDWLKYLKIAGTLSLKN